MAKSNTRKMSSQAAISAMLPTTVNSIPSNI